MAIIALYPPDSVHLSITINSRTYASIGGAPAQVQDFDAPVLEANGWTTAPPPSTNSYGTPIVEMTAPDATHTSINVDGRIYVSSGGSPVNVLFFDVPVLQANGWVAVYSGMFNDASFSALIAAVAA